MSGPADAWTPIVTDRETRIAVQLVGPATADQESLLGARRSLFYLDKSLSWMSPGIFTIGSSGTGQGAIVNQDGTVNSGTNPAPVGSIISVYATGEGQTDPLVKDGAITGSTVLPKPILPVEVTIGGRSAEVLYAGAVSNTPAGLLEVKARVPAVGPAPDIPVVLSVGSEPSQQGVTLAVGP